jgi:hypothetical protein
VDIATLVVGSLPLVAVDGVGVVKVEVGAAEVTEEIAMMSLSNIALLQFYYCRLPGQAVLAATQIARPAMMALAGQSCQAENSPIIMSTGYCLPS